MSSAEHPKAVVLLLLIHCSVLPPLLCVCVRVCVWGGGFDGGYGWFCNTYFLVLQSSRWERKIAVCFTLVAF